MLSMVQATAAITATVITYFITTTVLIIIMVVLLKVAKAARKGRGSREAGRKLQAVTMVKIYLTCLTMNLLPCRCSRCSSKCRVGRCKYCNCKV